MILTPLKYTNYSTEHKMSQQQNILKKKRSFKRRRFMENITVVSLAIIFLMTQNFNTAQAVPAMGGGYLRLLQNMAFQQQEKQQQQQQLWHQRYVRDVGSSLSASFQQQQQHKENLKDSLIQHSSSTEVSLEQPQGQCLLDGEYVPGTTVFCKKQVGCRAIQKTGHCCPDYKCDCQKEGKTYLNGDKLVDPETPCKVCYCQGGEILCSSVTCFHRDDCTPKYIPGVCCPEYDNCPVATSESTNNKTLLTTSTTFKPEIHQAENNAKITIKEITKPIEIRITNDNKAIPIQQMLKPATTTTSSTSTTISSTTTTTSTTTTVPAITSAISTTPISHIETIKAIPTINLDHNQLSVVESSESLSVDNTNKNVKIPNKGVINSGDTLKLSASVAYPSTVLVPTGMISTFAPLDSSAEVDDPVPALSVFSTQGLPEDPSKVNIKREYFITTEGALSGAAVFDGFGSGEYQNSELIFSQTAQGQNGYNIPQQQSSVELDPETAGSDNIYHIILTTDGPRMTSTSENYLALKGISTTEGLPFDDLTAISNNPLDSNNNLDAGKIEPTTEGHLKDVYSIRSSTESVVHQHLDEDDSALPPESNPAYPSLPEDDFSLRDNNFQINDSDDIPDEPRSISGSHSITSNLDSVKSTKHLDDHTYGSGSGSGSGSESGSGMLIDEFSLITATSAEGSGDLMSTKSLETTDKTKSSEVIQLMYSGEDSSEETRIANATDFTLEKNTYNDSKEEDSSLEASGNSMEFDIGSGAGEFKLAKQQKEREPTTPRPNKKSSYIDIDVLQDASGNGPVDDPKLDAESLKLDETADDTPANPTKSAKNTILSVKVQPVQEKQFHDGLH